ncbi:hypothetical protein H6F88_08440 [Oculatella sp. FACHB-28]|uniref:hypothetical protein n=1 Tax=Oculatella sp. FACHB-28 TaxID=2692845 RepID=UPI0016860A69|nr:hypothetical protein [Oculatella sp. FACHB-28]MBD2056043.1 hypothetical protein [Oculatella sp. FACHB-28]
MLYLNPPYYIIEGVTVYPDHADPTQFHYLPAMPHLTTEFDSVVGQEIPQLSLLKYRGEAGSGAFLNFEVNLGINQEKLEEVQRKLQQLHGLRDTPRMSPVMVEDGQVRLMILGKQSPDSTNGQPGTPSTGSSAPQPLPGQPQFVLKLEHYSKPALYNDHQAIFSVQLDSAGAMMIEEALKGEMMPVGIVYSLDFLALRPAYNVSIVADWNRVQTHFQESFGAEVLFSSLQIDTVVDKLIEDRVIEINVDTFIPEGEDSGGVLGRRDEAIANFKDMILENFFEPSLDPIKENDNEFLDTIERLSQIAPAGAAMFHYKKVDITRIDQKRMNLAMSERTTVRRSIHPQAHLRGMFRLLRDSQGTVDLSRFVREITLDDPWFKRREVSARSLLNFSNDSVDSVNLTLWYGNEPKTLVLDAANSTATTRWNSILENRLMKREVRYSYRVNFKDVDTAERPGVLQSPELVTTGDRFEINPRGEGLYFLDDIQIGVTDRFPWNTYSSVEVLVKYADPDKQIDLEESFILKPDRPEVTWKRFRLDRKNDAFKYKLIYRSVSSGDRETVWETTTQERLTVPNPTPRRRTVTVVPAVTWSLVSMIFVDLSYRDLDNDIWVDESLFFDKDANKPKHFVVDLINPEQRRVSYVVRLLLTDNRLIEVAPSETMGDKIFVRADMMGHRIVTVQPEPVEFGDRNIVRLEVKLRYEDPDAGLRFADTFIFTSPNDRNLFEYDYADAQKQAYSCTVRTIYTNGMSRETDLGEIERDQLVLRVS